ncbi:30S ribosomal protein S4 [Candidatus Woesebacteria bacterium]|nr:30S ribosomal protein S4 [Candidatus Woesebacteria bacterium]
MARYTGPKDRLSRREGFDLFGKGTKLTRLTIPPGIHGPKGITRKPSQYGRQLRDKQKVKRLYGILEKQFKRYVDDALKSRGNTGQVLISALERRLDNVVFRLGFSANRPHARQLVSHRHAYVNGKRVNIPSYRVSVGDIITLSSKIMATPVVKKLLEEKNPVVPDWLERKAAAGKVKRLPLRGDVKEPISEKDIVEFYSR